MKKFLAFLMTAAVLLSLAACGGQPSEPEAYIPSGDMRVLVAFLDGKAKVITEKTSEKELTAITLACVYFDENGQQIGAYEEISGSVSTNEKVSSWSFDAPAGCAYVEAAVAGVGYADETGNRCPGVETWAAETAANFSAEKHAENLENAAKLATLCTAVSATVEEMTEETLSLKLTNTGDKDIASVVVYTLWYDADGNPVEAGGKFVANASRNSLEDLVVEETATYTLETVENAASVKLLVQTVNFKDGTAWENANTYQWLVANYKEAK